MCFPQSCSAPVSTRLQEQEQRLCSHLGAFGGALEQVNYCTTVFNKVTECTGHSGSRSAVQTAALSLNSVELFRARAFYELFHFIFFFSAYSLVSAQAPEIVCDSSNSTLPAQVYLNTSATFSGIVPDTQEGVFPSACLC